MTDRESVRFVSAFAGVGGFDLAAQRLGWECVGQIEIADFPMRVLKHRFPDVPRWRYSAPPQARNEAQMEESEM